MALEELVQPVNKEPLPPFHILIEGLFLKLQQPELQKQKAITKLPISVVKEEVIKNFISEWRKKVGLDLYPAFRLILPDKDRARQMYHLKENSLGKLLVKVLNMSKDSPDAKSLLQWKQGPTTTAGNFSERCYDILKKRDTKIGYGDMSIGEVNELLDQLSEDASKPSQARIMSQFITRMNAEELRWLIRIILRYSRIGATEHTIFVNFHPDAIGLFNTTSDLKRVCWQLSDPKYRITDKKGHVSLMSCFQPQLAVFRKFNYEDIVNRMPKEGTGFYMEEKMDGERIQIHFSRKINKQTQNEDVQFKFYSRKGKDYTDMYGKDFDDSTGGLTKHLKTVIDSRVRNCIIDGEMVAWDPADETIVAFGSLKTAANNEKRDAGLSRPMYVAFDLLYLNDKNLVDSKLLQRKKALDSIITPSPGYFVVLPYPIGTTVEDIEERFQKVIEQASEGLVIKSPLSPYKVNDRIDTWIKVKPDYMDEFGENLDLCIIAGYYGKGKRGSKIASFLCGLRINDKKYPMKFWSFCKVGGGFTASDLRELHHITDGKWHKWDPKHPPNEFMEIGRPKEMPDLWIKPDDSLVVEVKAAQVIVSSEFRTTQTLRFPRFKAMRKDKTWKESLSLDEFNSLQTDVNKAIAEKVQNAGARKKRAVGTGRGKLQFLEVNYKTALSTVALKDNIFQGNPFFVVDAVKSPKRMTKRELEIVIKQHGGNIVQSSSIPGVIVIADMGLPAVASIISSQSKDIIMPDWIFDCISANKMLEFEPNDLFYGIPETFELASVHADKYGDSYKRPITVKQLRVIMDGIQMNELVHVKGNDTRELLVDLVDIGNGSFKGLLFPNYIIYFDRPSLAKGNGLLGDMIIDDKEVEEIEDNFDYIQTYAEFNGANIEDNIDNVSLTHVIVHDNDKSRVNSIRKLMAGRRKLVRIVDWLWITRCCEEGTTLAEENFQVNK